ncbi:hypothetical protein KAJ27_17980 [bacterium]|nr:hypothetical protein [Bacteroidales bacterium]MCK5686027.1 hypothetical protein [bacterium]
MKRKMVIYLLMVIVCSSALHAQQGKYVRKSVSSLESVWFQPGSMKIDFDSNSFDKFIDFYIEVDRFDYNILPVAYTSDFVNQANALKTINNESLSRILDSTVVDKILIILNNPEVMKARGSLLKSEAAMQSFAATKAKSLGLTTEELKTLLNSAYIYLPFVTKASKETDKKGNLTVKLEGGIIWWKVNVESDGSANVSEVLSATTSGISTINPNMKKNSLTGAPNKFKFGNESWDTTPETWALNDAMLAFTKNLGVKTKEIDDFKLSAQITGVGPNSTYTFPLGRKEGVFLDDGFKIVEYEENTEGEVVKVEKGFVRISKTGQNQDDPIATSIAVQILGDDVSEGTIVMEHPKLGIDVNFTLGLIVGSLIKPENTVFDIYKDDATTQLATNLNFAYNMAPIIGVSQTFLDLDLGLGLPMAEYQDNAEAFATIISSYLGVHKKFGRRMYFTGYGGVGIDALSISGTDDGTTFSLSIMAPGVKLFAEAGYLLNADLSVYAAVGYKLGMSPLTGSYSYDDVDYDVDFLLEEPFYSAFKYDELNMGGVMINVGASYALSELPINIFGFLDPFKKY